MAVYPTNDSSIVNRLGEILGVDLDAVISLNNLDGTTLTLRNTRDAFVCINVSELFYRPWSFIHKKFSLV